MILLKISFGHLGNHNIDKYINGKKLLKPSRVTESLETVYSQRTYFNGDYMSLWIKFYKLIFVAISERNLILLAFPVSLAVGIRS